MNIVFDVYISCNSLWSAKVKITTNTYYDDAGHGCDSLCFKINHIKRYMYKICILTN